MESIDPKKVASVWERVRAEPQSPLGASGLLELIAQQGASASAYLQLSRQFQGKTADTLQKMQEEKRSQAACLKGIYRLITDTQPVIKIPPAPQRSPETALRHCCRQEQHCLMQYLKRSSDPEFGQLFSKLAKREQALYCLVLELFGNLNARK